MLKLSIFNEVFNRVKEQYVEEVTDKELIENAKKSAPSKTDEKPEVEPIKKKSTKTIQELDREKLDTKFSKNKKLN